MTGPAGMPMPPHPDQPYAAGPPYEPPPNPTPPAPSSSNGRRGVNTLAVLFLGAVGIACVAALGYHAVVNGSESAINSLSIIAGSAIGAIAGLLSSGRKNDDHNSNGS